MNMNLCQTYKHRNSGFSLLEMMIAVAIMGIVAGITIQNMSFQLKMSRKIEVDVSKQMLHLDLLTRVDCRTTCANHACSTSNTNLVLRDRRGSPLCKELSASNPIVPPNGCHIADGWHINASMVVINNSTSVQVVATHRVGNNISKDLVSGKLLKNIPIIDGSFLLCGASNSDAAAMGCSDTNEILVGVEYDENTRQLAIQCSKVKDTHIVSRSASYSGLATDKFGLLDAGLKFDQFQFVSRHFTDNSVGINKISEKQIDSSKILNGNVLSAHIDSGMVKTGNIIDKGIETADLQSDFATNANIQSNAIDKSELFANNAVTTEKIVANSISDSTKFLAGSITTNKIINGSIMASKIENDAIDGNNIVPGAIDATKIATINASYGGIISSKLANGKIISNNHIQKDAVSEAKIAQINSPSYMGINATDKIADAAVQLKDLKACPNGEMWRYDRLSNPKAWKCAKPSILEYDYVRALFWDGAAPAFTNNSKAIWSAVDDPVNRRTGIQCDASQGWRMIGCSYDDNKSFHTRGNGAKAEDPAWYYPNNLSEASPAERIYHQFKVDDNSLYFGRSLFIKQSTCWSPDLPPYASASTKAEDLAAGGNPNLGWEIGVSAVCVRYSPVSFN